MLGLIRVFIGLATILTLGVAAVVALPETTNDAPRFEADWTWTPFRARQGDYRLPLGWRAVDAFSTGTRHGALSLAEPICPLSAQVAYFHSETRDRELYAMFGTDAEMEVMLATTQNTLDAFAAHSGRKQGTTTLADGTALNWSTTRVALGPGGGREVVFFVATAQRAGKSLILSGGAQARAFDLAEYTAIVNSIRLPG